MAHYEVRRQVIQLYKTLLYMGRDYPKGYSWFRDRCHNAFLKNKDVTDPEQVQSLIKRGEFVVKEIEALYYLKKYRTMKHRYYEDDVSEEELLRRLEKKADDGLAA